MNNIMRTFIAGLFFFVAAATFAHADVKIGEAATDFTITDTNGAPVSLSQFKGKYVVLEWINHDCPFVKKHYNSNNMQALQKEYTAQGVVWLSINSSAEGKEGYNNAEESNKLIQEKGAAPTAVLLDSDGKVGTMYGAKTTPHMYIINPDGILIYQGAIDDKASTELEDVPGAKNYVKAALTEAMAGGPVTESTTKSYGCLVKY